MTDSVVLWCLLLGDSEPSPVTAPINISIGSLKDLILEKCIPPRQRERVLAKHLVLLKFDKDIPLEPFDTLAERMKTCPLRILDEPADQVSDAFPAPVQNDILHIQIKFDTVDLWCLVLGEDRPFMVTAPVDKYIAHLKNLIWEEGKYRSFRGIDATDLVLRKFDEDVFLSPPDTLADRSEACPSRILKDPSDKVSNTFPALVNNSVLHILVVIPAYGSQPFTHLDASMLSSCIPRAETVSGLYEKLKTHKYIHVRGVSASGKTTLAKLLHRHILQVEINPCVVYIDVWPSQGTGEYMWSRDWLSRQGFRFQNGSTLILDNAQTSYHDQEFWLMLKNMNDWSRFSVITFARYGTCGQDLEHFNISCFRIMERQNVSLLRKDLGDGIPIGLLLSREEFNSLIARSEYPDAFDASFLDWVYDITNGHVGACCDLLTAVQRHPSFRSARTSGMQYSYETFTTSISTSELMETLRGLTLFVRGLPFQPELQEPDIAEVFRKVIHDGRIVVWSTSEVPGLQECFERGWLHNEPVVLTDAQAAYTFATPLHKRYVQWMLFEISMLSQDLERLRF